MIITTKLRSSLSRAQIAALAAAAVLPIGAGGAQAGDDYDEAHYQAQPESEQAMQDGFLDGKLETAFLDTPALHEFDIDSKVDEGVVYLSGMVATEQDRRLAGTIALAIDGVEAVENHLVVEDEAKPVSASFSAPFAAGAAREGLRLARKESQ